MNLLTHPLLATRTLATLGALIATAALSTGCGGGSAVTPAPNNPRATTVSVEGNIATFTPAGFAVGTRQFTVDPQSVLRDARSGATISLADLTTDDFVALDASGNGPVYTIKEMARRDGPSFSSEVEVRGAVGSITDTLITVLGISFGITDSTRILDRSNQPLPLSDIVVGTFVEVEGHPSGDALVASKIKLEDGSSSGGDDSGIEYEVTGPIQSKTANSLTVQGALFNITDRTLVLDHNKLPISFDSLVVGELVEAEGHRQADGSYNAKKIKQEDSIDDNGGGNGNNGIEREVEGTISALTTNSVSVAGLTFIITTSTRLQDDRGNPIPFSAFAVGQLVEAEGYARGDGTYTAKKIKQDDH